MKKSPIEAVIFDLDGTLVHTIEDIAGAANEMLTRNSLPTHEVGHYLRWIGSGAFKLIERAVDRELDGEELKVLVAQFKEIYAGNLHDRSRLYEGIAPLLDELVSRRIRLSILSNKPDQLTRRVASHYLSEWPFDPVFGQRDDVPRKPDPAAAREIAGVMGIAPERMLFVGDSKNDILTARAAGMIPLGVTWGYGRLESENLDGAVKLIRSPIEIASCIT